ncbi:MAG: reductive dehalogenase [Planctomycetota bacterium]|jgi:ferredoxin
MEEYVQIFLGAGWVVFTIVAALGAVMLITFIAEREHRAVGLTLLFFLPALAVFGFILLYDFPGRIWLVLAIVAVFAATGLIFIIPFGKKEFTEISGDQKRVDERDAVFHRFYRLEKGTPEFEKYYEKHPEKLEPDDEIRAMPPLAGPGAKTYDKFSSPFQIATFTVLDEVTRQIEWEPQPVEGKKVEAAPEEFSLRVKGFAKYLGAELVGCAKLNPAYVYSHIGRSPGEWGTEINLNHSHAIAIAVEMSHDMHRHAPDSPTTTETAFKYFECGKIAMLVTRYINLLGYEARAHLDGNYRVMCVPVAVDAGLGELGRLGLLITPTLGPRVRLAVVTTDMPLAEDKPVSFGAKHFCTLCKKCADCCPSGSVDKGDEAGHNGAIKWQSEQDSCYRYWRIAGSDCAVCMKVCPYSHPNFGIHGLIRWVISRNPIARRLALIGDDIFYGRRPKTKFPLPRWHAKRG